MGFGVGGVLDISRLIASWPNATVIVAGFGAGPLLWLTGGLAFLTLWISPIRWIGCIVLMVGVVMMNGSAHHEDVLIGREARFIAVRGPDDRLAFAGRGINRFSLQHYLHEDGDARPLTHPDLLKPFLCDKIACSLPMRDGRKAVLLLPQTEKQNHKTKATDRDGAVERRKQQWIDKICMTAAVIIAPDQASMNAIQRPDQSVLKSKFGKGRTQGSPSCQALVITPEQITQQGPISLKMERDGMIRMTTNNKATWNRPWAPQTSGIKHQANQGADPGALDPR